LPCWKGFKGESILDKKKGFTLRGKKDQVVAGGKAPLIEGGGTKM